MVHIKFIYECLFIYRIYYHIFDTTISAKLLTHSSWVCCFIWLDTSVQPTQCMRYGQQHFAFAWCCMPRVPGVPCVASVTQRPWTINVRKRVPKGHISRYFVHMFSSTNQINNGGRISFFFFFNNSFDSNVSMPCNIASVDYAQFSASHTSWCRQLLSRRLNN